MTIASFEARVKKLGTFYLNCYSFAILCFDTLPKLSNQDTTKQESDYVFSTLARGDVYVLSRCVDNEGRDKLSGGRFWLENAVFGTAVWWLAWNFMRCRDLQ